MLNFEVGPDEDELLSHETRTVKNWWQKGDDLFMHTATKEQQAQKRQRHLLYGLATAAAAGLLLSIAGLVVAGVARNQAAAAAAVAGQTQQQVAGTWKHIRRIAFSSCTSYDLRPQPIWTEVGSSIDKLHSDAAPWLHLLYLPVVAFGTVCRQARRICALRFNRSRKFRKDSTYSPVADDPMPTAAMSLLVTAKQVGTCTLIPLAFSPLPHLARLGCLPHPAAGCDPL